MTIQQIKIAWNTLIIPFGRLHKPPIYDHDYYCSVCGEPFDTFGVRNRMDMDNKEVEEFLKGLGCPCCEYGKKSNYCFVVDNTKYKVLPPHKEKENMKIE